ncbi:transient-receptor-potential-like protein [Trichonephila clavipes]|nr:transient-receptor-potential-like protein [Trichonephila clavipes]
MAVYIPREAWNAYDPMLIADGLFAAGNIFAALKLVHIFSINPYLGPLQISLGRMVIDIIKFFFIYALVLFAFACGLNQLLWYYADMEKQQCFSGPGGTENWTQQRDSCLAWRRFSNLFESSQTLFWASFGLVDISNFELTGIKSYTRFWGLLMFGSYSVINVVVLLNLLIAMMSNSYNVISERADVEWKFARTTLFMNYFEEGGTVPPPFNIFPTFKHLLRLFGKKRSFNDMSIKRRETKMKERDSIYQSVMCNLVWRYVTAQQKETESHPVTEDNINELRQDVYSFRHDLMRVFKNNGMNTRDIEKDKVDVTGKRIQIRKRRLIKDFSIGLMEVCTDEAAPEVTSNKSMLARLVGLSSNETRSSQRWRDLIQAAKKSKIIGNKDAESGRFGSIKKTKSENDVDQQADVSYNEFQNSGLKETENQNSESNLYPKIPEEDLIISAQHNQSLAVTTQPTYKTKTLMQNNGNIQDKQDSQSILVKLSAESLIKTPLPKPKEIKYQVPQPKERISPDSTGGDARNISSNSSILLMPNSTNGFDNSTSESFNTCSKIYDNPLNSFNKKEETIPKDTTITVTSSPEKTVKPRNKSERFVEIIKDQPNTNQLIDIKENDDIKCSINVSTVRIDNLEQVAIIRDLNTEQKEPIPEPIKQERISTGDAQQSDLISNKNVNQYQVDNEGNVIQTNEDRVKSSPLSKEKNGWL